MPTNRRCVKQEKKISFVIIAIFLWCGLLGFNFIWIILLLPRRSTQLRDFKNCTVAQFITSWLMLHCQLPFTFHLELLNGIANTYYIPGCMVKVTNGLEACWKRTLDGNGFHYLLISAGMDRTSFLLLNNYYDEVSVSHLFLYFCFSIAIFPPRSKCKRFPYLPIHELLLPTKDETIIFFIRHKNAGVNIRRTETHSNISRIVDERLPFIRFLIIIIK